MFRRIIKNDIKNSKLITLAMLCIITLAVILVSVAAALAVNLFGAVDALMKDAKSPHFMQMHIGEIDKDRLEQFAAENELVTAYQTLEFLNIEGGDIQMNGSSLADSVQDNGLCIQSSQFDFLLDLNGNRIEPKQGEIYLPIYCKREKLAAIGDMVTICGKSFRVAGFLRDSQMNSMLASSKRFLIHQTDYEAVRDMGKVEYLIEFRLRDMKDIGAFAKMYTMAGLEANGPAITYPLFRMINAMTDGIMIVLILFVSILILAIAFLCIRFTLLAKIEEEYKEIGVMKAVGLPMSQIKMIYLVKYIAIAGTACLLGWIASISLRSVLLQNIWELMGKSDTGEWTFIFSMAGTLAVFAGVVLYINRVLQKIRHIEPVEALRYGSTLDKLSGVNRFCISHHAGRNVNVFLGIKAVLTQRRLYRTMLVVFIAAVFMIIVPQNLYHTISDKSFMTYMGIGTCDIRIDIQQTEAIQKKTEAICKELSNESGIAKYEVYTLQAFPVKLEDGTETMLQTELGNQTAFPLQYEEGNAPVHVNEIALSIFNAKELSKKVGDTITLLVDGKEQSLTVSGIYADITNGGKTSKACFATQQDGMKSMIMTEVSEKEKIDTIVKKYGEKYSYAKVSKVEEFEAQTFGGVVDAIRFASRVSVGAAIAIAVLVTLLFMKLLLAKDKENTGLLLTLGFTKKDIKLQYIFRSLVIVSLAVVIGTILANTVGEAMAGMMLSQMGVASFVFVINPFMAYIVSPAILAVSVVLATIGSMERIGIRERSLVKE